MNSIVTLVSGGLDSTLVAALAAEQRRSQQPLFIDYGQKARDHELRACRASMTNLKLPQPIVADLSGYGALIRSGLTDATLDVIGEAFTPGRNGLFLLIAAAGSVAIGLLDERYHLFPDQTRTFLQGTEERVKWQAHPIIAVGA